MERETAGIPYTGSHRRVLSVRVRHRHFGISTLCINHLDLKEGCVEGVSRVCHISSASPVQVAYSVTLQPCIGEPI
jgi:hypothetical protein